MIHPRPSPIAAALYTLRDLEVDVIIMHGPAGCCFRTGRLLEDEGIRPPLNSIPGLGTVASQGIEAARTEGEFMSMDDLRIRSKIGKSAIETLKNAGCLQGMSESNQMSLFA